MDEKAIVIGGGVGPMAGVALHALIIENTLTDGKDQGHLEVHHFSRSSDLPDRTAFLLGSEGVNPAEGMARTLRCAWAALSACGKEGVGAVPCNTFHAPEIFGPFLRILKDEGIRIPVLHMLDETARFIDEAYPGIRRIGVLSTSGTRKTGIYRDLLQAKGLALVDLPEERQDELQDAIYNSEWGLKAASPASGRARGRLSDFAGLLASLGAEAVILGCTEIPLALPEKTLHNVILINPVLALARALIREAAPRKLKAL